MKRSKKLIGLFALTLVMTVLIPVCAGAVTYYEVNNADDDPEVHTFLFLRDTPVYYPGYTTNIIDHYAPGTCVQYLGKSPKGGWYFVRTPDGKEGYMYHTYLKQVKKTNTKGSTAYVKEDAGKYYDLEKGVDGYYAKVYSDTRTNSQLIASFLGGTKVTVLEENGSWVKVYSSGVTGYMRKSDIDY